MSDKANPESRKSIGLNQAESAFKKGARYLVIPADLKKDFAKCVGIVHSLDGYGAWLKAAAARQEFPKAEEVFLIEFVSNEVVTHRTRILKRRNDRVWVDAPSLTLKERSKLAPSTGRKDYRVRVDLPVRVLQDEGETKNAELRDLSRGGMSLETSADLGFKVGQSLEVQLVSWDEPVSMTADVKRIQAGGRRVALRFPKDMSDEQRETVSSFILQVQRRDALKRDLPAEET